MKHEESNLQKQCVAWFRAQYPQYAMLLIHPINEGSGNSRVDRFRQAIHKAEGAVAGVPDLILFIPSSEITYNEKGIGVSTFIYHALGIEFKTPKGSQAQEQKDFEAMFKAAQYKYVVVRSFEIFKEVIENWIDGSHPFMKKRISEVHKEITKAAEDREREKFYKIIGKK